MRVNLGEALEGHFTLVQNDPRILTSYPFEKCAAGHVVLDRGGEEQLALVEPNDGLVRPQQIEITPHPGERKRLRRRTARIARIARIAADQLTTRSDVAGFTTEIG